ncbi:bifunctional metallophosphatase/5'-nucleotidase [Laspinema sp. A4]|uniref:bifunctional metallophosphatase/5'-nucleotidase n=1 Tax=Laspinema sp. D2d TaxID=2953686 RepID=UPI0021BB46E3|nr:bifunctional metallophosphatase/5'-nucleotidase [Laspinema sp. D2d]MCT7982873.1 bifunctional metallophosphatase/5'-nucleotidase [Laspinema sp. D2d]
MKRLKMGNICSIILSGFSILVTTPVLAEIVNLNLLHLNDINEITPPQNENGRGGLARVATLRQQLLRENPHTFTLLAGDLLSPSGLGNAQIEGQAIAGQQMIAVMNTLGLDYATFGNHEFDLRKEQFYARLQASNFQWVSTNVSTESGEPFEQVPRSIIFEIAGEQGTVVRVGLIGLTLDFNQRNYVTYADPIQSAKTQIQQLQGQVDILVALTHLSLEQDKQLADAIPEIDLILGGHEHENIQVWRGANLTPIFKADANARTVYVHRLSYDTTTQQLNIVSELFPITQAIPEDLTVRQIINEWLEKGYQAFRDNGFNPDEVIATLTESLDGLDSRIRHQPTNLTRLLTQFLLNEVETADLAILNSGAIRIDDVIEPGPITQYDILRLLPFSGIVRAVEMKGSLLEQVLTQGIENKGTGGYLQTANVKQDIDNNWMIADRPLDPNQTYTVVLPQFLVEGREQNLEFLTCEHHEIRCGEELRDIRLIVIEQWKKLSSVTFNSPSRRSPLETLMGTRGDRLLRGNLGVSFLPVDVGLHPIHDLWTSVATQS